MIIPPLRATWARWKGLSTTQYSLLRALEYERIAGLMLRGRTLDVGGGRRNSYYHLLKIEGTIESVNIDSAIEPTLLADLNDSLPFASASYDNVISLNTLEHIRNDLRAAAEIVRVLRPGGQLHLVVPFLYRVHGSPGDYHRHTAFWWEGFFLSLGLAREKVIVEPLLWDPFSSAFSLVEFSRGRGLWKKWVMLRAVFAHARWRGRERLPEAVGQSCAENALGYYIYGIK